MHLGSRRIGIDCLYVGNTATDGGFRYAAETCRAVADVGADREIVFAPNHSDLLSIVPDAIGVPMGRSQLGRLIALHILLPLLVVLHRVDVLICLGNISPAFVPCPVVLVVQNRLLLDTPSSLGLVRSIYRRLLGRRSLATARAVVAVSWDLRDHLISVGVRAERVHVVPEGVDSLKFAPAVGAVRTDASVPYVLCVASLWPYKRHELVLRSYAIVSRRRPEIGPLLLIGAEWGDRLAQLQQLAVSLEIASRTIFAGAVPAEEMPRVYAGAGALLMLSQVESFGLPVLEAMSCGVPVVASGSTAVRELLGDAGIFVEDDEAVAAALEHVLTDRELALQLGARGRTRALDFPWSQVAQRLVAIANDIA